MKALVTPPDFPLATMRTEVADGDTMFDGRSDHYLSVGLSALDCVEAALQGRTPARILDLPCGFGRVTRVLRARYPAAQISVCDLDRPGVDFAAAQFDARPIYSVDDLAELRLGEKYDLVWVGSLLTHLSEAQSRAFLHSIAACLARNAVLVVTSHGPSIATALKDWGYGLQPRAIARVLDAYKQVGYGHSGYGDDDGYGISLTDRAWWRQAASDNGLTLVSYRERAWDAHQDVVVLRQTRGLRRLFPAQSSDPDEHAVVAARASVAAYDDVLIRFDAAFYLHTYPDVAQAVQAGRCASAYAHYRENGRQEGRLICPPS